MVAAHEKMNHFVTLYGLFPEGSFPNDRNFLLHLHYVLPFGLLDSFRKQGKRYLELAEQLPTDGQRPKGRWEWGESVPQSREHLRLLKDFLADLHTPLPHCTPVPTAKPVPNEQITALRVRPMVQYIEKFLEEYKKQTKLCHKRCTNGEHVGNFLEICKKYFMKIHRKSWNPPPKNLKAIQEELLPQALLEALQRQVAEQGTLFDPPEKKTLSPNESKPQESRPEESRPQESRQVQPSAPPFEPPPLKPLPKTFPPPLDKNVVPEEEIKIRHDQLFSQEELNDRIESLSVPSTGTLRTHARRSSHHRLRSISGLTGLHVG